MPIDYAIGVGTFVPNNAVIINEDAVALMAKAMKERGIVHTVRAGDDVPCRFEELLKRPKAWLVATGEEHTRDHEHGNTRR